MIKWFKSVDWPNHCLQNWSILGLNQYLLSISGLNQYLIYANLPLELAEIGRIRLDWDRIWLYLPTPNRFQQFLARICAIKEARLDQNLDSYLCFFFWFLGLFEELTCNDFGLNFLLNNWPIQSRSDWNRGSLIRVPISIMQLMGLTVVLISNFPRRSPIFVLLLTKHI